MSNPAKRKGDRAELEVQGLLRDLLGVPARRKLGAGRLDDMGDIDGVPDTCIQVASYTDLVRAVREKVPECEAQQARAGATFGATFVKRRGGGFLVVMTPEQWATYARESMSDLARLVPDLGGRDAGAITDTESASPPAKRVA